MSFPYMLVAEATKVLYVGMPETSSVALQTGGVAHPLYQGRWGLRGSIEEAPKTERRICLEVSCCGLMLLQR